MEKLQIINLSNYIRPEIREVAGKKWVLNGDKNSFYQTIIDAYNGSPTNSAIIDSYSQFIYGKGLTSDDKAKKPSEWAAIMSLVSKKDLRKICKDFEMFGEASIEVKYINNKIQRCFHIAKQRIAPEVANEEGDITGYYYSYDFSNVNKYKPERFDAFGFGDGLGERSEIYIFRDYQVGQFYYSNPSYVSGISWAKMEEEISNYSINHIQKGLSFGHIINMNCGIQESAETIQENTRQIRNHLTGSQNAGAFFLNWNDNKDSEITISALEVSDAHQQYAYLSAEARQQLCTSHKLTSPMLVGIKEANGFSSNAEEIKVGFAELMINVIRPKQEIILDGLMEVFAVNGITLDLQFESLRAEEVLAEIVTDSNGAEVATVTNDAAVSYNGAQISSAIDIFAKVREGILTTEQAIVFLVQFLNIPVGVAQSLFNNQSAPLTQLASQHVCCSKDDNGLSGVADALIEMGEILNEDEWIEIDAIPVTKELEINEITLNLARSFASFPNVTSEQDTELFKIRYSYEGASGAQRDFCQKMISAGRTYRKEDIILAGSKQVNPGFGPEGADEYNVWLYKGSVNCRHYWMRKIYLRKNNKQIGVNEARKMILDLDPADRPQAKWQENEIEVAQIASPSNNFWSLTPNYRQ
jgi:hypothetical protein